MAQLPLLPERHPTRDFFIADIFDNLPVKDDLASMEHPFFTLSTKPDRRNLLYENGNKTVKIVPSNLGLPTIFDKDVLLYCGSQVMEQLNKGEVPPRTLRFSINDFLVATNRPDGGAAYKRFESTLIRLRGCTVETTIKTGGVEQVRGFGLIESYGYVKSHRVKDRAVGLEITLSDWFYNSLIAREVLTISRDYFRLRKSIERRVYEIARKHCGSQAVWKITLEKLYAKSGALSEIKHFRAALRKLSEHNHLPDYTVSHSKESDLVTFYNRNTETLDHGNDTQENLFSDSSVSNTIPPDLLDDVRNVVGIGPDYYGLWEEWNAWKGSKNANDRRGAFIGFCQKKTSKK